MINLRSITFPLFFFSGFAGLIYEVVWVRQFAGIFGSSVYSTGAVTAAFMGGMALGSLVLGRVGDRSSDRLILFAICETVIGIYGILFSFAFPLLEDLCISGFSSSIPLIGEIRLFGGAPGTAIKFVIAGGCLIIPTFFMGGTLPILCRFIVAQPGGVSGRVGRDFGRSAGGLYAIGTLGAAAGTLVAGFIFLESLGAFVTLCAVGAVNLAVAGTAVSVSLITGRKKAVADEAAKKAAADPTEENPDPEKEPAPEKEPLPLKKTVPKQAAAPTEPAKAERPEPPLRSPSLFLQLPTFLAFFLSGAAVLGHEVLWTRLLSQFFRNSAYSFASMLVCVLVGLAAGGGAGAWFAGRTSRPRYLLCLFQAAAALCSLLSLLLIHHFGQYDRFLALIRFFGGMEEVAGFGSFTLLVAFEVVSSFCVIFPAAFFMGTAFPLMAEMNWRRTGGFGGFVGDVQFLSTAGAVVGALVTAFYLLATPEIEILHCAFIVVGFNVGAGLLLLLSSVRSVSSGQWTLAAALFGGVGLLLAYQPPDLHFWRTSDLDEELVFYEKDVMADVSVVRRPDGLILKVNNTAGLGGTAGEYLETRIGMLPSLLLPEEPEETLCLGLGTGNTLMGLVNAGAGKCYCVELVESVIHAAAHSFHNFPEESPHESRRPTLVHGDARIFLAAVEQKYDLIVGDLFFPWQSEAGFLYTKEHFTTVREHLKEGGVFCQWIPLYQLHWDDFGIIGNTFAEVFDSVSIFLASSRSGYPVVGLFGSEAPMKFDPDRLQERIDNHPQRHLIERFGLANVMDNLVLYLGSEWLFRVRFPDRRINTIDRTLVEFRAARILELPEVLAFNHFTKLAKAEYNRDLEPHRIIFSRRKPEERQEFKRLLNRYTRGIRAFLASHAFALGEHLLAGAVAGGQKSEELMKYTKGRFEMGVRAYEAAPEQNLFRWNLIQIWKSMIQQGDFVRATRLMELGFSLSPDTAQFACNWGMSLLAREMYEEAAAVFKKALEVNPDHYSSRIHYAAALFIAGKRVQARQEMEQVVADIGGVNQVFGLTRSKLASGLAILILHGVKEARPWLDSCTRDMPWMSNLIQDALNSASESARKGDRE